MMILKSYSPLISIIDEGTQSVYAGGGQVNVAVRALVVDQAALAKVIRFEIGIALAAERERLTELVERVDPLAGSILRDALRAEDAAKLLASQSPVRDEALASGAAINLTIKPVGMGADEVSRALGAIVSDLERVAGR